MDEIKVAVVGVGNMGSAHFRCIYKNEIKNMSVVAACDINDRITDFLKRTYRDINVYNDYDKMLENSDINAVIIATPHPYHCEMAIKALKKSKHVLVEKPIDISISRAQHLNEIAETKGKVFAIMFNQRTNRLFAYAKDLVESGELGELKRSIWIVTNWYRTQAYYNSGGWRATWAGEGGGVLLNQAPHNLDLWQWICGMPKSVTAYCNVAKYHNIEVEDEATIYTEYENGATGVFITSTGDYPGTNRFEISGTKGKLVIENGVLKLWNLKEDERDVCLSSNEEFVGIEKEYSEYTFEKETAHKGILQNFTNAILYGEKLIAPGIDGINELTISNAAYLSSWQNNKKITIPFDIYEFDYFLNNKINNSNIKNSNFQIPSGQYNSRWNVRW